MAALPLWRFIALGMALAPAVAALTARLLLMWSKVVVGRLVEGPLRRLAG